ncbi:MAG: YesL family protein [Lachnospiraceae bacterium]|nr:YesL family protein [Lachnospiraceae bacterium]
MSNHGTFGENNPVWRAISRFADMMVIGIIFLVSCLPIFTIGAALSAFYYTAMDSLRKEDGYIFKRYFRSFASNFKKGTILWLIMLVIGGILGLDVYFWVTNSEMQIASVMFGISIILAVIWFMTFVFVFPLQARFENTVGKTIQNAFLIAITHLPFTIATMILIVGLAFLCYISWLAVFAMVLFGVGVVGYLLVYNYERLFKKCGFIDENDGKIENDDYDFEIEVDYEALHNQKNSEAEENIEEDESDEDNE